MRMGVGGGKLARGLKSCIIRLYVLVSIVFCCPTWTPLRSAIPSFVHLWFMCGTCCAGSVHALGHFRFTVFPLFIFSRTRSPKSTHFAYEDGHDRQTWKTRHVAQVGLTSSITGCLRWLLVFLPSSILCFFFFFFCAEGGQWTAAAGLVARVYVASHLCNGSRIRVEASG